MKSNYEKHIEETNALKEKVYEDFIKSGHKKFSEFLKEDLKNIKLNYKDGKKAA